MNAGRELDALVAEKVMGLQIKRFPDGTWLMHNGQSGTELFHYSTDIAAAWEVWKRISPSILYKLGTGYEVYQSARDYEDGIHLAHADTAPLAICLAALKVKEAL